MAGNWIATNWWQLFLAIVLLGGYVVTLSNSIQTTKQIKAEMKGLKKIITEHLNNPSLHRGPDFELRMLNMERQLEAASKLLGVIGEDLKAVLRSTKANKE